MNLHPPGGGVCPGTGGGGWGGGGTHNLHINVKTGPGIPSLGSLLLDIRLSVARLLSNPFPPGAGSTIIFIV